MDFQAKQSIAKQNNCFLVEGYTDVIQFNQSA
jgi:DNA primase